jgi:hypothetical protein
VKPAAATTTAAASTTTTQSSLGEFLRTYPSTFSQAKDPIDAEDWLKSVEKKLEIA